MCIRDRVQQACQQDGNEYHYFDVTHPTGFTNGNGPGEQEGGFEVENDEQDGGQVKRNCDLQIRRAGRDNTRLIDFVRGVILATLAE